MSKIIHPHGFRDRFVSIALGQVGVREVGSNGGKQIHAFQSATYLEPGSWAWCAAFVCWAYRSAALGFQLDPDSFPETPAAYGFESWGKDHAEVIHSPDVVLPGDIVSYEKFSHVGIVAVGSKVEWKRSFITVEGNTNASGGREGDGVYRRSDRTFPMIRSIVRLYES